MSTPLRHRPRSDCPDRRSHRFDLRLLLPSARRMFRVRARLMREVLTPFVDSLSFRLLETSTRVRYYERMGVAQLAQQGPPGHCLPHRSSRKGRASYAYVMVVSTLLASPRAGSRARTSVPARHARGPSPAAPTASRPPASDPASPWATTGGSSSHTGSPSSTTPPRRSAARSASRDASCPRREPSRSAQSARAPVSIMARTAPEYAVRRATARRHRAPPVGLAGPGSHTGSVR